MFMTILLDRNIKVMHGYDVWSVIRGSDAWAVTVMQRLRYDNHVSLSRYDTSYKLIWH